MNGKMATLSGTDNTTAQQFLSTFQRSEHLEPEKALLRAILEDAVHCYKKYRAAENRVGRERFREVEAWIAGSGNDWIFSFGNVCELLGLDPGFVRQRLHEQTTKAASQRRERQRSHLRKHAA